MNEHPLRFLQPHMHLSSAFGDDAFGRMSERIARTFGTPQYILS